MKYPLAWLAIASVPIVASPISSVRYYSDWGEAEVAVLSEEWLQAPTDSAAPPLPPPPVSSLSDFTSRAAVLDSVEALLDVHYLDFTLGKDMTFPLKYSQVRAFLDSQPGRYRQGDAGDRNLAMLRDIIDHLQIRIKETAADDGGTGK
jgi:hypothetical protein